MVCGYLVGVLMIVLMYDLIEGGYEEVVVLLCEKFGFIVLFVINDLMVIGVM